MMMATGETLGAFLKGLRIVVMMAPVLMFRRWKFKSFGRPSSRPGTGCSFSPSKIGILVEAGTHNLRYCVSRTEWRASQGIRLLRSVTAGMLLMWEDLHSYAMVQKQLIKDVII